MRKLVFTTIALMMTDASVAVAAPLCTPEDVHYASTVLGEFRKAMDAGALPKVRFLEQERILFMAQHCSGNISATTYCQLMTTNYRSQLALARKDYDRAYALRVFEVYIIGMNALKNVCGETDI